MTTKQLRAAAEEMIDMMNLQDNDGNTLVIDKKTNDQDLIAFIKKAADMIDGDEFSEETQEVIDAIMSGDFEPKKEIGKKPTKKQPEPEPEPEEDSLIEEIEDAESLKALIVIAKKNDEFKSLVKKLVTYKKMDILRKDMLAILEEEPEPEEPEFEEEPKPKAPVKTPTKPSKKQPEPEPELEPEHKAKKKDTNIDAPKKQKQTGKKRSTIFAECMSKATKKPIQIESIIDSMSEEYQGSVNVSKFYVKTMIDYLGELDIIEVSDAGILFKI
jgi:hypothetical protein